MDIFKTQRLVVLLLVFVLGMLIAFPVLSLDRAGFRTFVEQQYRDFLGREGEVDGIEYWTRELEQGRVTHADMADLFFSSREFQDNIAPVARLYFAYFGRIPDYPGLMHWVEDRLSGGDLERMSQAFADSNEFVATYGELDYAAFVDRVYENVLARSPDSAGRTHWVNALRNGMSRGAMMVAFSESDEYRNRSYHQVQVTMMYVSMLRRSPEQSGFEYWVSAKAAGGSILDLIDGFLRSDEYLQRLGLSDVLEPEPQPVTYRVSVATNVGGNIVPRSREVAHGQATSFEVIPDTGFVVDAVRGCGGSLIGMTYMTGLITEACTVEVVFTASQNNDGLILGRYLPIEDGSIIRDTATGLEWQRCSVGQVWDGGAQRCTGDAEAFIWDAAIQLTEPGEFRVPTIEELQTLVYCSNAGHIGIEGPSCGAFSGDYARPTIVQLAFPNTPASIFWSASPAVGYADHAWYINFYVGTDSWGGKGNASRIRLVRGGD